MRKKKIITTVIIVLAILAALAGLYFGFLKNKLSKGGGNENVAYVTKIADLMGVGGGYGMLNRFAGVIESQETWSAKVNQEYTVKEVFVKVGDNVKVGTPLFEYDVDKFETDLKQGEIDLERLQNELESLNKLKEQLEKDAKKAPASEKTNYTIQLEEQALSIKQKEIDIETKKIENEKLKENMANSVVKSQLEGVVKTVNNNQNQNMYGNNDDSFITVMKVGDLRVKGSINEQNMYDLSPGVGIIVYSRVDKSQIWHGVVEKIDTENAQQNQNMYGEGNTETSSSKYPFYVVLDNSDGLMLGQHVYMELDLGQAEVEEEKDIIRLGSYYIVMEGEESPFVWVDEDGVLKKRTVELGDYDEEMMEYVITSGLTMDDAIAFPEDEVSEGMKTADIEEFVPAEDEMTDEGMETETEMNMGTDMEMEIPMEGAVG